MNVINMGGKVGKAISQGIMENPVIFRTHGGRAGDMERGASKIDIAFLAAPAQILWEISAESMDLPPAVPLAMPFQTPCLPGR